MTKEDFLNTIYRTYVLEGMDNYLLVEDCLPLVINESAQKGLTKSFSPYLSSEQLEHFYATAKKDTQSLKWESQKLMNSICISRDSASRCIRPPILVVNSKWSQKRLKKEQEKLIEQHESKPLRERKVFFFSRPIFSPSREYAIMYMSSNSGNLYGHRCIYLFQNTEAGWIKIASSICSIS